MPRIPQILALAFACMGNAALAVAETSLPDVRIGETNWATAVLEFEDFDDADASIGVALSAETAESFKSIEDIFVTLAEICSAIMAQPSSYILDKSKQSNLGNLTHVQIMFDVKGEMLFPYPIGMRITEGKCTDKVSFVMPTLIERFSRHSGGDEFFAVVHTWGLGKPEVTFTTGTKGKVIKAEIELLKNFGRKPEELPAMALCVHMLANLEPTMNVLLLKIKPENYSKIEIEIFERPPASLGSAKILVGKAAFGLEGGKCVV